MSTHACDDQPVVDQAFGGFLTLKVLEVVVTCSVKNASGNRENREKAYNIPLYYLIHLVFESIHVILVWALKGGLMARPLEQIVEQVSTRSTK